MSAPSFPPPDPSVVELRHLVRLGRLATELTGVELPAHKAPMIAARLLPRLRELQVGSFEAYLERLDAREREVVVDRLTTHETSFFRDREQLAQLAALLAARFAQGSTVRAWSAACSTGEEAWTLGMMLSAAGYLPDVLGTDVAGGPLAIAAAATYDVSRADELPTTYLKRFMLRGVGARAGQMRVARELRASTRFARHNLGQDPDPRGPFDLVLVRNVLMYFSPERRKVALAAALGRLSPRGLMVLARVDSIAAGELIQLGHGIYAKAAP